MSSHGHGGTHKPKKDAGSKKQHIRNWMHSRKKKKNEANLFAVMMSSGDSSSAGIPSVSPTSFNTSEDDATSKDVSIKKPKPLNNEDAEAIEEATPIITTLPTPGTKPKIERNGLDVVDTKKSVPESEDSACNTCIIDCIYVTQQCCECTIL